MLKNSVSSTANLNGYDFHEINLYILIPNLKMALRKKDGVEYPSTFAFLIFIRIGLFNGYYSILVLECFDSQF